jgi:nucleotide-binding universal stress UspA family protein
VSGPFARILLATEHTDFDVGAERVAFAMAKACGLRLAAVLPMVTNSELEATAPEVVARAEEAVHARLIALRAAAASMGVEVAARVRRGDEPWHEIIDEAHEIGADLVVARRRGKQSFLARMMVGEMVGKVATLAPCSVLLVPRASWLLKREILWVPVLGWAIARFKPIAIDRKAGGTAVNQVVTQGRERLSEGLGVIIYQMLSGRQPYNADTGIGVAVKHVTEPVPEMLKVPGGTFPMGGGMFGTPSPNPLTREGAYEVTYRAGLAIREGTTERDRVLLTIADERQFTPYYADRYTAGIEPGEPSLMVHPSGPRFPAAAVDDLERYFGDYSVVLVGDPDRAASEIQFFKGKRPPPEFRFLEPAHPLRAKLEAVARSKEVRGAFVLYRLR